MPERRIVHFSGAVQGVGFRASTCSAARGYDVTGRVQNLRDGRVRVVAEGEADEIDAFLEEVRRRMGGYVSDEQSQHESATGEFSSFDVVA